jgi:glycosyl-4,4'-diaponeurosporenoate acyltransferase
MPALGFWPALAVDSAVWPLWSVAVGCWAAQRPDAVVERDGWLTRLRPWERDGLVYARLGIRRWKGWLPDLGGVFGGRPKRLEARRDPEAWATLAAETRRAERAHWLILLALPAEALLRSGVVLAPMAVYAVAANAPCIAAQRHNRGRLLALQRRRAARREGRPPVPPLGAGAP